MNEEILFNGFIVAVILYVIVYVLVLVLLKKKGFSYSFLNTDLSNYGSLRKLIRAEKKYKWLYLTYLIATFLPILIVILFIVVLFT